MSSNLMRMVPNNNGSFSIETNDQTVELLSSVPTYLNMITVVGDNGTGKSAMLNALAGSQGEFTSGYGRRAVTQGADLSILNQEQQRCFGNGRVPEEVKIALVDLEGIGGEHDNSYFAMLLSPFVITSRVIILNLMSNNAGRFPSVDTFKKLCVFCLNDNMDLTRTRRLARLVIVLRDVIGTPEERQEEAEAVKSQLFNPTSPNPMTFEFEMANMSRQFILNLFGGYDNIAVVALPAAPGLKNSLRDYSDPDFQEAISNLRDTLVETVQHGHTHEDGVPLTGQVISEAIVNYTTSLNNDPQANFDVNEMGLIQDRMIDREKVKASNVLNEILASHVARGLVDPSDRALHHEVDHGVLNPFRQATQLFTSKRARQLKTSIINGINQRVATRVRENNDTVSDIVLGVVAVSTADITRTSEGLYRRIRENVLNVSNNDINIAMDALRDRISSDVPIAMSRAGILRNWPIFTANVTQLLNEVNNRRRLILAELIAQQNAVFRVRDQSNRVQSSYYQRIKDAGNAVFSAFRFNNDVHQPHFQNVTVDGVSIMDVLRAEPMLLGVDGTLNDFRDVVRELGARQNRPSYRNFNTDLMRAQIAVSEGSTFLPMSSGAEFNGVPLGQMLSWAWNLVRLHSEREEAAIRMIQEISEGIEQHPDPTHGNPNPNCGSGRSPRLINALRGFVDIGFQTVEAINMPAFHIEFVNEVTKPTNLSLEQRLERGRKICNAYGIIGTAKTEWLNSVRELY